MSTVMRARNERIAHKLYGCFSAADETNIRNKSTAEQFTRQIRSYFATNMFFYV